MCLLRSSGGCLAHRCSSLPPLGPPGYCMGLMLQWNYTTVSVCPLFPESVVNRYLRDKTTAGGWLKSRDCGCFCTIPKFPGWGFLWVLHGVFNYIWKCFDDWAPFGGEGRYAQKHTQRQEEEEGVVRQQTDTRQIPDVSIPSKPPAQQQDSIWKRVCEGRLVQASPATWSPCEENKVWQGAVKLHKM